MRIKKINSNDFKYVQKGTPLIRFDEKSGVIRINKAWVSQQDVIKHFDDMYIGVIQDQDNPKDYYVYFELNPKGNFKIGTDPSGAIRTNSSGFIRKFFKEFGITSDKVNCQISTQPTVVEGISYFAILTKGIKPE